VRVAEANENAQRVGVHGRVQFLLQEWHCTLAARSVLPCEQ
jgi:hypothetical protein